VITYLFRLVLAASFLAIPVRAARAQAPAPAPVPPPSLTGPVPPLLTPLPAKESVLLKVQVVISRYQGEKKISSQPYTLSVGANGPRATMKMGTQVPVLTGPAVSGPDGKPLPQSYNYRTVGATIECTARSLDDGRYRIELTLDDSSVAAEDPGPQPFSKGIPQFRSFQISGATAVLRDGQSTQLTTAAEKVTGEIAKVDVTVNVVK
jgi:hypothetical protein